MIYFPSLHFLSEINKKRYTHIPSLVHWSSSSNFGPDLIEMLPQFKVHFCGTSTFSFLSILSTIKSASVPFPKLIISILLTLLKV